MNQIFTAFRLAVGAANGRGYARHFLIALALVSAGGTSVSPRQSGQTPTFRTRVDAVTVDVNATDAQGRPVTDLAATDFEVKENGKLQSINSFRRFTIDEAPTDATPAPITSLDTQEREAARDDVRLIVVFLDELGIRDQVALRASRMPCQIRRKIFRRYIQNRISQNTVSTAKPRSTGSNGGPMMANGALPRCRTSADEMKCSIVQLMT